MMISKKKGVLLCFLCLIGVYQIYCTEKNTRQNTFILKKKSNSLYQKMYCPYIDITQRKDLCKNDIRYIVPFVKEIDFSDKNNAQMFKGGGYKDFIECLFSAIYSGEIIAYKDKNLTKKMSAAEVKKNMIMPKNVEFIHNDTSKDKFFSYDDVSIIEIDGYYVSTIAYPNPVMDNIVLTLILPSHLFDDAIQHFVCSVPYEQCISLFSKKKMYVYKNGKRIDFDNAIGNEVFNYMFLLVDNIPINQKYKIKNKKYSDNHIAAKSIFRSKREDVIL